MKTIAALVILASVAHTAITETSNGVTYTVTYTDRDGRELPVVRGPKIDASSRRSQRTPRRDGKTLKRDQTFSNWCGASNIDSPGGSWNSVSGTWTVPQISLRQGQSSNSDPSLVQWVGIDGDGCNTGLIQGGSGSQLNDDGSQYNYAWFEFVPNPLSTFDMEVNTGDSISGYVTATSQNTGNITVINNTSGRSMNMEITDGPGTLCGQSAEWILEDLTGLPSGNLEPFAEFPDNVFTDCSATTTNGQTAGPGQNHNVNLSQNGQVLCAGTASGSNVYMKSTA